MSETPPSATSPAAGGAELPHTGAGFPVAPAVTIGFLLVAAGVLLRWRELIANAVYRRRH
jgi:LPXTG-motif cell wall-anchored protein